MEHALPSLRLLAPSALSLGDLICAPASRGHGGKWLAIGGASSGQRFLALDGEHAFAFWDFQEDQMAALRIVESHNLIIKFDELGERIDDYRRPGTLTIHTAGACIAARTQASGFWETVLIDLATWLPTSFQISYASFATYPSWQLGSRTIDGGFAKAWGTPAQTS